MAPSDPSIEDKIDHPRRASEQEEAAPDAEETAPETPGMGNRRKGAETAWYLQVMVGNQAAQRWAKRNHPAGPVVVARDNSQSDNPYDELEEDEVPPGDWGPEYRDRKSRIRESYDTYKGTIGKVKERPDIKAASEWGGRLVKTTITTDQLTRIANAAGEPAATARISPMAGQMSSAFATMAINTAQAQAAYIAHMAGETGGVLEENLQGVKRDYVPFQGRGPVQVTHEYNYVQTLAYIEKRIEQLEKMIGEKEKRIAELRAQQQAGPTTEGGQPPPDPTAEINRLKAEVDQAKTQVQELREAHSAVKGDPKKAADPKYAFLFSAAYMHMTGGVRSSAQLGDTASFTGKGAEDRWVTGGNVQKVVDEEGKTKNVSMTFEQRRQYAAEHNMPGLESDMKSAISRGDKKSKVYGMAVSILSAENGESSASP